MYIYQFSKDICFQEQCKYCGPNKWQSLNHKCMCDCQLLLSLKKERQLLFFPPSLSTQKGTYIKCYWHWNNECLLKLFELARTAAHACVDYESVVDVYFWTNITGRCGLEDIFSCQCCQISNVIRLLSTVFLTGLKKVSAM